VDRDDQPVVGATVEGAWSSLTSGIRSASTAASGFAALTSFWAWGHGTFTFTAQDMVASGYECDPEANEETSDFVLW
jgi:hypothetical protein